MKDALTKVLVATDRDDASVDRILAASFFRTRPMQAGAAPVIRLDDRRARSSTRASS